MSWRETLGVTPSTETPYTYNTHNTQNPTEQGNCADIADSAYRDSEQENSKLLEALADACKGLDITPAEVKQALAPEDIADWCSGGRWIRANAPTTSPGKLPVNIAARSGCGSPARYWAAPGAGIV